MTSRTLRIFALSGLVAACGSSSHEASSDPTPDAAPGDGESADAGDEPAADGSEDSAVCEGLVQRPFLKGCVVSDALVNLTPDGQGLPEWQLVMEGTVSEVGRGEPPGGCDRQPVLGAGYPSPPDPTTGGAWLRLVSDAGDEALVALAAQGASWRVQVGERLAVDFRSNEGDFNPNVTHLTVRDADGALRAWMSSGGSLEDLTLPPELERVEEADLLCIGGGGPDACIESYEFRAVDVTVDGEEWEVSLGEVERVGAYDVLHGGLEIQTGESYCTDAFVAHAALAAFLP